MTGLRVTVPVACWRRGLAREYLESDILPPPATCYGAFLSLVGETDPTRHCGARVTAGLLNVPGSSVVLRSVWRVKSAKEPQGSGDNVKPDFQQLRILCDLVLFVDSNDEASEPTLEARVREAFSAPEGIRRFGGWSLGESTHLINDAWLLDGDRLPGVCRAFVLEEQGTDTMPTWVDHVGTAKTRFVTGVVQALDSFPVAARLPKITPGSGEVIGPR